MSDAIPSWKVDLAALRQNFAGKSVSEAGHAGVVAAEVRGDLGAGGLTGGWKAGARLSIRAASSPKEWTEDSGGQPFDARFGTVDEDDAWLSYALECTADVSLDAGTVPVGSRVSSRMTLIDSRLHPKGDDAVDAVISDLAEPRSILRVRDIERLAPGDSLSLERQGQLRTRFELGLGEAWSRIVSELAAVGGRKGTPLAIAGHGKAVLHAEAVASDDFVVTIGRRGPQELVVAARKGSAREAGGGFSVRVEIDSESRAELSRRLVDLIEAHLAPLQEIERILRKVKGEDLTPLERTVYEAVVSILGIESAIGEVDAAVREVRNFVRALETRIVQSLEAKLGISWSAEYARLESHREIVRSVVPGTLLHQFHAQLLEGDFRAVTAPPARLEQYLDERVEKRSSSWVFTLRLRNWAAESREKNEVVSVTRRTADRTALMLSLRHTRTAECGVSWGAMRGMASDLRADMTSYEAVPQASHFLLGLQMRMEWKHGRISEVLLNEIADAAQIWKVISGDIWSFRDLVRAHSGTATLQFVIPNHALRALAKTVCDAGPEEIARAMAAAVPYVEGFHGRSDHVRRVSIYSSLWRRALDEPGWSADPLAIAAAAAEATFSAPADGLPQVERERAALWSFARLVEADSHYGRDWATFLDGWRDLAEIDAQPPEGETSVPAMMKKLDSLFDQPLTFRAAGAFLAAAAAGSGELDRIERTLRFDIDDGRVVNVAG